MQDTAFLWKMQEKNYLFLWKDFKNISWTSIEAVVYIKK